LSETRSHPQTLNLRRGFDAEVIAGGHEALAGAVREHAAWLSANADNQAAHYGRFLAQCRAVLPEESSSSSSPSSGAAGGGGGAVGASPGVIRASEAGGASGPAPAAGASGDAAAASALQAVADFNPRAAAAVLESEVREAFLGTAGSAAGAQGLGLLAASWLGSGLEDLLAVTVAGLAGYVSVLNLPLRRADIKAKVARAAAALGAELEGRMSAELAAAVDGCASRVAADAAPLEAAFEAEIGRLEAAEARRQRLEAAVADLLRRAADLR
jgi:hypothetical protein